MLALLVRSWLAGLLATVTAVPTVDKSVDVTKQFTYYFSRFTKGGGSSSFIVAPDGCIMVIQGPRNDVESMVSAVDLLP